MKIYRSPFAWLAFLVWGSATALAIITIRSVSFLDARTWPVLKLDPVYTGTQSIENQNLFVVLFVVSYLVLIFAGVLWGQVFVMVLGPSVWGRLMIFAGIFSLGSYVLWSPAWAITFWLEDMGYYIVDHDTFFNYIITFIPLGGWVLSGFACILFTIITTVKFSKRYAG